MPRYHFDEFVLSPRRRLLLRGGTELPLIPRYFDLLVFLVEHRQEAVHRRDIFDRVWSDSVVSDSALSQAIRTIRRVLDDDPRDPRFIRTVSRHGYRFVFPSVIEEAEEAAGHAAQSASQPSAVDEERHRATDLMPPVGTAEVRRRQAATRWIGAAIGPALAGIAAGGVGGLMLAAAPGSHAPFAIAPVLAVVGGTCGAIGGIGVGAGLALAETAVHAPRALTMTTGAALGGGAVGAAVQWLTRWALASLFGLEINIGGALEGVVIGGAAGLGLAFATRSTGDAPTATTARARLHVAVITAVACGLAGLALSLAGRPLASGTIHAIANAAQGSRATLAPLGRLIGEPNLGPISSAILAFGETAAFGLGLALGLTRRSDGAQDAGFPPV